MQQPLAFTHRCQMRNSSQASVLAGDDFLLPAEVEAFASGAKDARCIARGTLLEYCLCDPVSGKSDHQSDAALRTMEIGRVSVLVPIHLLPIVVVRFGFVSIVATVAVVLMVLPTSGMGLSRAPLQLIQLREHLVGHDAVPSLARPLGPGNSLMQSDLCCLWDIEAVSWGEYYM